METTLRELESRLEDTFGFGPIDFRPEIRNNSLILISDIGVRYAKRFRSPLADHGYYFEEGYLIYSPDQPLKWEKASFRKTILERIIPLPNQSLPFSNINRSPNRAEELYMGSTPETFEPEVPRLSEGGNLVWLASSLKDRKAPFLDTFIQSALSVYPRVCERALHYGESEEWIQYCFSVLRYWMFLCNKSGIGQFSGIDEIVQDIVQ